MDPASIPGIILSKVSSPSKIFVTTLWGSAIEISPGVASARVGLTKDFGNGLAGALAYIGTNANNSAYYSPTGDNTGKGTVVVSLTKTF